jgi:hypothetical protein
MWFAGTLVAFMNLLGMGAGIVVTPIISSHVGICIKGAT